MLGLVLFQTTPASAGKRQSKALGLKCGGMKKGGGGSGDDVAAMAYTQRDNGRPFGSKPIGK